MIRKVGVTSSFALARVTVENMATCAFCGLPARDDPIEGPRPLYHCEAVGCGSSYHVSCLRAAQEPLLVVASDDAAVQDSAMCPACRRGVTDAQVGSTREDLAGENWELAVPQGADMLEIARLQQIMQGLDPTHSFDLTEELQIRFIEMLVRCARPADSAGATGAAESEAPTEAVDATMDEGADIGSV